MYLLVVARLPRVAAAASAQGNGASASACPFTAPQHLQQAGGLLCGRGREVYVLLAVGASASAAAMHELEQTAVAATVATVVSAVTAIGSNGDGKGGYCLLLRSC
jgi:hypothetical protein